MKKNLAAIALTVCISLTFVFPSLAVQLKPIPPIEFDPGRNVEVSTYEEIWKGTYVPYIGVRHEFFDGIGDTMDEEPVYLLYPDSVFTMPVDGRYTVSYSSKGRHSLDDVGVYSPGFYHKGESVRIFSDDFLKSTFSADPDSIYDLSYGIEISEMHETHDIQSPYSYTAYTYCYFQIIPGQANGQTLQTEGLKEDSNGSWYQYPDGSYAVGWKDINGKWYFFGDDGYALTGWQMLDGKWYFFYSSGRMCTGYAASKGKLYCMDGETGAMLINSTTPDGRRIGPDGVVIE